MPWCPALFSLHAHGCSVCCVVLAAGYWLLALSGPCGTPLRFPPYFRLRLTLLLEYSTPSACCASWLPTSICLLHVLAWQCVHSAFEFLFAQLIYLFVSLPGASLLHALPLAAARSRRLKLHDRIALLLTQTQLHTPAEDTLPNGRKAGEPRHAVWISR